MTTPQGPYLLKIMFVHSLFGHNSGTGLTQSQGFFSDLPHDAQGLSQHSLTGFESYIMSMSVSSAVEMWTQFVIWVLLLFGVRLQRAALENIRL